MAGGAACLVLAIGLYMSFAPEDYQQGTTAVPCTFMCCSGSGFPHDVLRADGCLR